MCKHETQTASGVQVLLTNASKYSKGMLSEILDFVMGQGLIPADGEVWKTRRRCAPPPVLPTISNFLYTRPRK